MGQSIRSVSTSELQGNRRYQPCVVEASPKRASGILLVGAEMPDLDEFVGHQPGSAQQVPAGCDEQRAGYRVTYPSDEWYLPHTRIDHPDPRRTPRVGTRVPDDPRHRSPDAGGHGGRAGAGYSTCVNAWMSTPTMHPTIVPLMRMNCRSRPTWSSMRAGR